MRTIKVGSRDSKLAVIQSRIVINMIKEFDPSISVELVTMKTTGDKILDRTLDKIGGKGLFVKELDRALLNGQVDITVHSLKDVPAQLDERIPLRAFTKCHWYNDVLVLPKGVSDIDFSKPLGSSSARRCIQLKSLYPNAVFAPVRGNLQTRLDKLDRGDFSGLILAQAGLERLGLGNRISRIFTAEQVIPAAGQGIIAVQTRQGESFDFLDFINDKTSQMRALAERAFVKALDGGCSSPVAAFARLDGDQMELTGFYGENGKNIVRKIRGNAADGENLGISLAKQVKEAAKI